MPGALSSKIELPVHAKAVLNPSKQGRKSVIPRRHVDLPVHARIAYYHQGMFGVTSVWSAETDKFISTVFIFFVMWTGLAKWPIYPWYKKRQNRKKREAKAEAAAEAAAEA